MPLLSDNNFIFTNNLAMRKALAIAENLDIMIDVNGMSISPDELKSYIRSANNDLWSFMYIKDNIPNSKAIDAFAAKTSEVAE